MATKARITLPQPATVTLPLDQAIKSWLGEDADDVVAAEKAQGSITFHYVPNVGDKLVVNGVPFTFIAGVSADEDIQIKSTPMAQAVEVATVLNASADAAVSGATYAAELHPLNGQPTGTVSVTHDAGGLAGNQFTLKSSSTVNKSAPKAIEVTPKLRGGHAASTRYGEVVQNFINE